MNLIKIFLKISRETNFSVLLSFFQFFCMLSQKNIWDLISYNSKVQIIFFLFKNTYTNYLKNEIELKLIKISF